MTFFIRHVTTNKPHHRLKASFTCSKAYRQQFPEPIAQMTISVGQAVHEGERLQAVVQLINKSFTRCQVMIDDSIQWRTLAIIDRITPQKELMQAAIRAGDNYLTCYSDIFKHNFTIPYDIIRWKDWVDTPEWHNAIDSMHQAYQENTLFREAVNNNVRTFLQRYEKKPKADYDRAHAEKMCTQYLLEECGVMKNLWIVLGCHYEIYPSGRNEAMAATHKLFIEPYHRLLLPIGIRFNRRKGESILEKTLPGRPCNEAY